MSPQRAIWHFDQLPGALMLTARDTISAKLTCSIFRFAKRTSDDARVVVRAVSHTCPQTPPGRDEGEWHWGDVEARRGYQKRAEGYAAEGINLTSARPGTTDWKAVGQLAEEYGYYEVRLPSVLEHTEVSIDLPVGLLRNALKNKPEVDVTGKPRCPLISIYLKCETEGLLLGVAEPDLYLVEQGQGQANAAEKSYSFADPMGRFSLTFPVEPVRQPPPRDVPARPDSPVQLAIWEARTTTTKFFLYVTYAPAEVLDATFDLEKLAGGSGPHWRVVSRREITLDGQPAKQVEYEATDAVRESVSVFTRYKGTVVSISVNGPVGQTRKSKAATAFIESFRFTR